MANSSVVDLFHAGLVQRGYVTPANLHMPFASQRSSYKPVPEDSVKA